MLHSSKREVSYLKKKKKKEKTDIYVRHNVFAAVLTVD